ncbi:MAG: UDP-N-acetylmuramoyl-L-alanine--D-glutamate ligase, partial [Anaerolineae bacterium]
SNVLAACAVAGAAKIPLEAMQEIAQTFKGVPHRLELVATVDDVLWVNDSIATSPERVIAALESFKEPIVLLLGGRDKKLPWEELAAIAVNRCKALVCFGEHGPAIAEHARRARGMTSTGMLNRVNVVSDLAKAVELAEQLASGGDVVLLSPGATSYDAYKDFEERGEHFRQLVERVRRKRM